MPNHSSKTGSNCAECTEPLRHDATATGLSHLGAVVVSAAAAAATRLQFQASNGGHSVAPAPAQLRDLQHTSPELHALDLPTLRHRLRALAALLHLDEPPALALCAAVPGLLAAPPAQLGAALRRVRASLGLTAAEEEGEARRAVASAPLLLLLPPPRIAQCVAVLCSALALRPKQARALVAEWPQLATLATATLADKLTGLAAVLGPAADGAPGLAAAVRRCPRLLTFRTSTLAQHHAQLAALLGPARLVAVLRTEPGLLALRPASVASKLRLLQQLFGAVAHPQAVATLVAREPGILRRSLQALSRGCRSLSIWNLPPRAKLLMCISRPCLLTLPWGEVYGRCRWLRRLMLGNGYYHAALRRLPPSVLGAVVAALPHGWCRLQYLAESSQEAVLGLAEVVECRQEAFEGRFPEFRSWLAFKCKQMAAQLGTAEHKPGQAPACCAAAAAVAPAEVRRAEQDRVRQMDADWKKKGEDDEYKAAEERTAKKRLKRQKKKQQKKQKKGAADGAAAGGAAGSKGEGSDDSGSDSDGQPALD
ncbi:hypothetical protein TSOC_008016 [Tetrabaena socialis]|uniref:Uncharacterized protein n=1 Tax=Tetrabaena socialis TaxID=47790 RepID=A0A2J7ZZK9_9CHLO|nr:hypothetical protein TSOC_008016 [Tetrabaena socialis]|eukprot:PNH05714.1 hypothetical protein TSOC_008016 [Tetrabaena socialis]